MKTILCQDSIPYLIANQGKCGSIVTSPPDAEEIRATLADWEIWFYNALALCLRAKSKDAPCIFYVTDRKANGGIISKANICFRAAALTGDRLIFHKIALRRAVDKVDLFRPTFTHIIAFGNSPNPQLSPDVINRGKTATKDAMGIDAAKFMVRYAGKYSSLITDPFNGVGTVTSIAEDNDIESVGIDIDPTLCEKANTKFF